MRRHEAEFNPGFASQAASQRELFGKRGWKMIPQRSYAPLCTDKLGEREKDES
jgi:hypothetical protein